MFGYEVLHDGIDVTFADGKKLKVHGREIVKSTSNDDKIFKIMDVIYITRLYRRLLSIRRST